MKRFTRIKEASESCSGGFGKLSEEENEDVSWLCTTIVSFLGTRNNDGMTNDQQQELFNEILTELNKEVDPYP